MSKSACLSMSKRMSTITGPNASERLTKKNKLKSNASWHWSRVVDEVNRNLLGKTV